MYHRMRKTWLVTCLLILGLTFFYTLYTPRAAKKGPTTPAFTGPYQALVAAGTDGFLPFGEALKTCQRRRWEPYATRDRRRKVYDLFLINTELDFLEIRLNELDKEVDFFIVLESPVTFQGDHKPLHLNASFAQFTAFHHKIVHRILDTSALEKVPKDDTWQRERLTRNALFDQALTSLEGPGAPAQGDVLLIGDVDEIPRPSIITALRNCAFPPRVTLRSQMYYYSYQWLHRGELWNHPQATYYNGIDNTIKPESLRVDPPDAELSMAGWHCSSCFRTLAGLRNKITSFSHKVYNHPYILDNEKLVRKIQRGEDIFEREGEIYDRVDNNPDIPTYLLREENRQRFAYMLNRDLPNANFEDL